jgi:methyl-accepting chemotaxis protein
MRIRTKATLAGVLAVIVSVAACTIAVLFLMRDELTRQAHAYQDTKMRIFHDLLRQQGEPKVVEGKLMFGDHVINSNYAIVDKLAAMTGGTATIFLGNTRISTNVTKDDGSRAIGTPLVGVAEDIVLNRGQRYRGEADILGAPYFAAYDPLTDKDGKTFAVLYVGVKQSEFFRSFKHLVLIASAVGVGLSVCIGLLVAYFVGRLLGRLATLSTAADAISLGENLDIPLLESATDEIGELSKSIDRLRESMRAAMKRLEAML